MKENVATPSGKMGGGLELIFKRGADIGRWAKEEGWCAAAGCMKRARVGSSARGGESWCASSFWCALDDVVSAAVRSVDGRHGAEDPEGVDDAGQIT